MLVIMGKKVYLREFSKDNLTDPKYFSWLRDLDVVTNICRLEYLLPLQFEEVENYVYSLLESNTDCFFAIYYKENDEFIGTLRIGHIVWRTGIGDIGILIGNKDYWGKGLSKDSIRAACTYAFNDLSLRKLTAGTPVINIPMCKCFERIGFKQEGQIREQSLINGKYVDHILFGLFRNEFVEK